MQIYALLPSIMEENSIYFFNIYRIELQLLKGVSMESGTVDLIHPMIINGANKEIMDFIFPNLFYSLWVIQDGENEAMTSLQSLFW